MKLSQQGALAQLWRNAGLINIKEEPLSIDQAYSSFNDYWEPFTKGAGPGGAYVVSLSEGRRQQLEARMRKRLLGDRQDGPFTLSARAWCARGEVPTPEVYVGFLARSVGSLRRSHTSEVRGEADMPTLLNRRE